MYIERTPMHLRHEKMLKFRPKGPGDLGEPRVNPHKRQKEYAIKTCIS